MPKDILKKEEIKVADNSAGLKSDRRIEKKLLAIEDFKAGRDESGNVFITGYANTKNKPDRYGDIPSVFNELRENVYDLKEFKKNPIMLYDHENSVKHIVGSFNPKLGGSIEEDEKGLKFKAVFSNSDHPDIKHIRTVYEEGHAKALSIGGIWHRENKDKPNQITLAEIMEISLVGIGADPNALTDKALQKKSEQVDTKAGRVLSKANEDKLRNALDSISEVLKALEKEPEPEKSGLTPEQKRIVAQERKNIMEGIK